MPNSFDCWSFKPYCCHCRDCPITSSTAVHPICEFHWTRYDMIWLNVAWQAWRPNFELECNNAHASFRWSPNIHNSKPVQSAHHEHITYTWPSWLCDTQQVYSKTVSAMKKSTQQHYCLSVFAIDWGTMVRYDEDQASKEYAQHQIQNRMQVQDSLYGPDVFSTTREATLSRMK